MAKRTPGLTKRGPYWHINKVVRGIRIYESTRTGNLEEAERYLIKRINEAHTKLMYGQKKQRTFIEAATKYLNEMEKKSLARDAVTLKAVMPYIGNMRLEQIHMGTLGQFIDERKKAGIKNGTINRDLAVIRRVLTLAARLWRDDQGNAWLSEAPLLQPLKTDSRKPYPISWDEQTRLLAELPQHLADMILFAVNTGCREQEICGLRWRDEIPGEEMVILPGDRTKNGEERIIPLNTIAQRVIGAQRGNNPEWVFTYKGRPVNRINGHAWRKARNRAGLKQCRVHDLRHTFGRRLRAAGVSFEDRQDLLGHKSKRITTHYSKAEIDNLKAAVETLCATDSRNIRVINLTRLGKR
jgi:integrase